MRVTSIQFSQVIKRQSSIDILPPILQYYDLLLTSLYLFHYTYYRHMKKGKKCTKQQEKHPENQNNWESIKKRGQGYLLVIAAKPNAKQTKVTQINPQFIGVSIAAPPRQGQANQQLIQYLAIVLQVKKSLVYVDKGNKSRNKNIMVDQCQFSIEEIVEKLQGQI